MRCSSDLGKTEEQLKEEGVDYVKGVNPYIKSAMGTALLSDRGFATVLIDPHLFCQERS